ncbi:MAG: antitoxin, RHH family protein [Elusimicrobia bacterium]|nr:antitoxin, RHH family protein [Candidatus Liberimonas magnetica]
MTTKNPRINLVIEKPLFHILKDLSAKNALSLSSQVRDLIIRALEDIEDIGLANEASQREKNFNRKTALSFETVMGKLK